MIDMHNLKYQHILFDRDFNNLLLEQMVFEKDFMISCMKNNIILEADKMGTENLNPKKGFKDYFDKIIQFFKNIVDKFANKLSELLDFNKKWLEKNMNKLEDIDYTGLEIEIIPYWLNDNNSILAVLDKLVNKIDDIPKGAALKKLSTNEPVEAMLQKEIGIKPVKGATFSDALKEHFAVGQNPYKVVTISGNELKNHCTGDFLKYLGDYHDRGVAIIKERTNKIDSKLKSVQRLLNTTPADNVKESFCLLENEYYINTELRYCYNADIVFEAEEKAETTNATQPVVKDTATKKTATTTVKKNDNTANTPTEAKPSATKIKVHDLNEDDVKYRGSSNAQLTYLKEVIKANQLALGTAMNVMENKYKVYMNVLREVVKTRA